MGIRDGHVLGNARVIGQHGVIALAEILLCLLADGDNHRILALHLSGCQLEHAGVIAACEAAVARDNKEQTLFHRPSAGVCTRQTILTQNACDGLLERVEIRSSLLYAFLGTAQLARCDQLHRLGDLHGRFDASDTLPR